jgi:hypothetical protein
VAIDPVSEQHELICLECGLTTADVPHGWAAFRVDLESADDPELAFYCPAYAEAGVRVELTVEPGPSPPKPTSTSTSRRSAISASPVAKVVSAA